MKLEKSKNEEYKVLKVHVDVKVATYRLNTVKKRARLLAPLTIFLFLVKVIDNEIDCLFY